ncbi:transcriptional Coactivator p15-domain-containing protein [Aspergillus ambiguus]|uniref:transcriptional coactivator p15/PC4 family protein n=1 Tax=Aspergillus ambiguus TaxID=176160 RepID=UPI003CCD2D11
MGAGTRKRISSDFVVDDDDERPEPKRTKTKSSSSGKVDANGDRYWEISKMRRVTISSFRGKTMVNIREYYEKDGQELPGKKGISLPMDQYKALLAVLPDIETILKEKGESVPRPEYADSAELEGADEEAGSEVDESRSKKNIEATSDEDESEE